MRRPHAAPTRGMLRRALRHRDFRFLLAYIALSQAAHLSYVVALSVFMFQRTGSPAWVSAVVIARGVPVALLSALAGTLADRWEHRRLLLVCTVLDASVLLAVVALMALSGPAWLVLPLVAAGAVIATPLTPALMAYMPAVVTEDDLVAANTGREMARKVAQLIGPAAAGVLIAAGSPSLAVAASLVAALLGGLCLLALRTRSRTHAPRRAGTGVPVGTMSGLAGGVAALRERPGASALLWLFAAYHFVLGFEHVLYTVTADQVLGLGADGLGYLFAAVGFGGVLVAAKTTGLAGGRHVGTMLAASIAVIGTPFIVLGWVQQPVVALVLLAVVGAGGIVFHVLAMTTLQRVLPRGVLGRVTGLRSSATYAAMLLGSLAAPALVAWVGLRLTFLMCGLLLIASAAAALSRMTVLSAAAEQRRLALLPLVALLENLRIFEGAPRPTLEALAAELEHQPVKAGQDVVRQGEAPDHLYVIESGQFVVLVDGDDGRGPREVATLGPGDYFGEIGLLRGIPRIATVRAASDAVLHRLEGWRFLAQVVDGADLSPRARQSIDARVEQTARLRSS